MVPLQLDQLLLISLSIAYHLHHPQSHPFPVFLRSQLTLSMYHIFVVLWHISNKGGLIYLRGTHSVAWENNARMYYCEAMHVTGREVLHVTGCYTTRLCLPSGTRCPCAAALINDSSPPPLFFINTILSHRLTHNMEMTYRPLLPPTQFCPCEFEKFSATQLNNLPHSRKTSPFYRSLFAPYSPLWINSNPARKDNSPHPDSPPEQTTIDYRLTFERQKKAEARYWDSTAYFASLYTPKGRWQWTHQVTFETRSEEVPMSCMCARIVHVLLLTTTRGNQRYTLTVKTAQVYQESIAYISKLCVFPVRVFEIETQIFSKAGRENVNGMDLLERCAAISSFSVNGFLNPFVFLRWRYTKHNSEQFMVLPFRL